MGKAVAAVHIHSVMSRTESYPLLSYRQLEPFLEKRTNTKGTAFELFSSSSTKTRSLGITEKRKKERYLRDLIGGGCNAHSFSDEQNRVLSPTFIVD